jgi:predicted ribosomally synthesized peptide with nif11-like leader
MVQAMSEEQLKAFMEAVNADAGLQEKLNAAADSDDAVVAIAKEAGFVISADLLQGFPDLEREISEEDLEGVAGGGVACKEFLVSFL